MKKLIFIIIMLYLASPNNESKAQSNIPYTAQELVEKAIQFHDPEGKWNNYSGKVKLNTSFPHTDTYGTEIIEIDVAHDFYKCTRLAGESKVVKGIENGEIFRSINGCTDLKPEEITLFGLSDQGIQDMKEWHYFHFGKLAHFISGGSELQNKIERCNYKGKNCYLLTFIGDSAKVSFSRWAGEIQFYLDVSTFAIYGIQWTSRNVYETLEGSMVINGIKLPRLRTSYTKEDNVLQFIDLFTTTNDNFNLPEGYRTKSKVTGNNARLISTHLLKLENDEALKDIQEPLKELNEILAEMGYPECGYLIYAVNAGYDADYTHIMEGWWLSNEVYELTHSHPKYIEYSLKYKELFENILTGQTYFKVSKVMPNP